MPTTPAPTRSRRLRARGRWAVAVAGAAALTATSIAPTVATAAAPAVAAADDTVLTAQAAAVVKIALTPAGDGAYLLRNDGSLVTLGNATSLGNPPTLTSGEQITTILPSSAGYLLVSSRGRVFPYGNAVDRGGMGGTPLNGPIVDVASTVTGDGYWMLGSDGGVFSFGNARFHGSTGNIRLNSPANGIVPDADGVGYRFVAGDGGVFAYEAQFRGSMGGTRLNRPVVGMIAYGNGYLMVASDGGVFNYSDKPFYGSLGGDPAQTATSPVVGIAAPASGTWYVLVRQDGAVFPFGAAPSWLNPSGVGGTTGNPNGTAVIPAEARAADTSRPTTVVGNGTAASCTSAATIAAIARGGVVTFNCGPSPVTITLDRTATVPNPMSDLVIDGGNRVTLSGGGQRRILYVNTCDQALGPGSAACVNQPTPRVTVQNITFADGNSIGIIHNNEPAGGGAIFQRGGRLKIVNARFVRNRCEATGPDVAGGAVRVFDQGGDEPVFVVNSTFGGSPTDGNTCSNGPGLGSIGVTWQVLNSVFTHNSATGVGANPARSGTPGGGSGGAMYFDGGYPGGPNEVRIAGTVVTDNSIREGGSAVFFVSNDRLGHLTVEGSTFARNSGTQFETWGYPGIFYLGRQQAPTVVNSSLQR